MSTLESLATSAQAVFSATTDAHFHMLYADAAYFQWFGNDAVYSIIRTIHDADTERLLNAAASLPDGQTVPLVLRMRGCTGEWRWMLVRLRALREGDERQYQLSVSDVFAMQTLLMQTTQENTDFRFLLNLMHELTFHYSFTTKHICLFTFDCGRKMILTDEPLVQWKQHVIESGMVAANNIQKFEKLCTNIETGCTQFHSEFESSICSLGKRMEYCAFHGITRASAPMQRTVLGTVKILNARFKTSEQDWLTENQRDHVTELLNKHAITSYAKHVIAQRPDTTTALVLLLVDGFKEINEQFGHLFGDEVLQVLSQILQTEIDARGAAGRIGGGMFLLVLEQIADENDLRGILRAIRTKFEWAWNADDAQNHPRITCSMGAACCPQDADNYDKLFMQADKALYIACEKGHNRYVIYNIEKHGEVLPNQKRSVADLYANVPTQSKAGFVAKIAKSLLLPQKPDVQELLQGIGAQFGIDGIHIFTAKAQWEAAAYWGHPIAGNAVVLTGEALSKEFQEDDLCVIDNVNALEGVADEAYAWLNAENVQGAVLYRAVEKGQTVAVVLFGLFGHYCKWSTLDANHLTILGSILCELLNHNESIS